MNKKYTYIILVIIVTVSLYFLERYVERQNEKYPEMTDESYQMDKSLLPSSTTNDVIEHVYYTLSYSEKHEQSEWVAYQLDEDHISNNEFERPYFIEDRKVRSSSADWRNYKGSGFDKGHLCPAGDRKFSYDAFHETFLTSNISPQDHDFNAGVWNRLEQKTRYWAKKYNGVFVVTGGVLMNSTKNIGEENVTVPNAFYKIVMNQTPGEYMVIAFLVPNEPTNEPIYNFVTTIDHIEELTGIDFFPAMEDHIENKIESQIELSVWGKY